MTKAEAKRRVWECVAMRLLEMKSSFEFFDGLSEADAARLDAAVTEILLTAHRKSGSVSTQIRVEESP